MWSVLREIIETLVLALFIYVGVQAVVQNFQVVGSSMEPTLHTGQRLLVNKAIYFRIDTEDIKGRLPFLPIQPMGTIYPFAQPQRGDIVVLHFPNDLRNDYIKRIVGLPGESIEIRNGQVFIDSQPLEEPYLTRFTNESRLSQVVPPDYYYVLGDNRPNSSDSRTLGPVPRDYIIGKPLLSYWPVDRLGPISDIAAGQREENTEP